MAQTFTSGLSRIFSRRFQFQFPWGVRGLPAGTGRIHLDHVIPTNDSALIFGDQSISKDKDILLNNIKKANSSSELFSIIATHGQLFNQKHVIESLSCLHEFNKAKEFDITGHNVLNDPIFEKLCVQLKKFSRVLEMNEIIEALKVLALLRVPVMSTIFQTLLQLIRCNINNLELDQVVFLDYILKQCEHNHLIDAIQLALPLVFQLNISSKMDRENVAELTKLLRYSSTNNVPLQCVTSIATSLVIHTKNIDIVSAKGILFSLTEHRFRTSQFHIVYNKLINKCFSIILPNVNKMSFLELLRMMERLKEMIILQHYQFYNSEFFTACGDYVINKKLPFISALQIMRILTRIAHCHLPLLDYISDLIILDMKNIETCKPGQMLTYVNALSNANYKPDFFEDIKEGIIQNPVMFANKLEIPWAKFAMDLAVLDVYSENFLKTIFSSEFLRDCLLRKNSTINYLQLLALYQAVRTFHPLIEINFPPDIYQKAAGINCSRSVDGSMKASLTKSLGGSQYLASHVQMPLGIFADFVIAFRDGGYPIAINPESIEDPLKYTELSLPSQGNTLCVLNYHDGCYSVNNKRLRGQFDLTNRVLQELGYKVLPLCITEWVNMPESERTLYLMREVNVKYSETNSGNLNNNVT